MKHSVVLEGARKAGAILVRHGKKHDLYENPRTHEYVSIPRHPDINEYTAKSILKKLVK